jgi:hypothetical protein
MYATRALSPRIARLRASDVTSADLDDARRRTIRRASSISESQNLCRARRRSTRGAVVVLRGERSAAEIGVLDTSMAARLTLSARVPASDDISSSALDAPRIPYTPARPLERSHEARPRAAVAPRRARMRAVPDDSSPICARGSRRANAPFATPRAPSSPLRPC